MKYKIESYPEREYCVVWQGYYKRGFFSSWVQLGKDTGYSSLDECIVEISKHKTAMLELNKLNGKNLRENL